MKRIILLAVALLIPGAAIHATEPIAAFTPGARILFKRDSITGGNRDRSADPNHILGHSYAFIIAAKYGAAFASLNLEFINRGVSGYTVLDLQKHWTTATIELKPDVVTVLIGINNEGHGVPVELGRGDVPVKVAKH